MNTCSTIKLDHNPRSRATTLGHAHWDTRPLSYSCYYRLNHAWYVLFRVLIKQRDSNKQASLVLKARVDKRERECGTMPKS